MSMDKSGRVRRAVAAMLAAVTALAVTLPVMGAPAELAAAAQDSSAWNTVQDAALQDTAVRYREYRAQHPDGAGQGQISIEAADGRSSTELRQLTDHAGQPGISVLLPQGSSTEWRFTVSDAGWYTVTFLYCPTDGGGNSALADLLIDGALPFAEAAGLSFERRWINEDTGRFDKSGNQIRSRQTESPAFMTKAAEDAAGEAGGALGFYLTAGEHTLTIDLQREPLVLRQITFAAETAVPTYAEVKAEYDRRGYRDVQCDMTAIEAEDAPVKSDQCLYPVADRSSPTVSPYSAAEILYNTVGGRQWKTVGQWLEWTFSVPESGLYTIALHEKQNAKSDAVSVRELTIDGVLPFTEAESLTFAYASVWKNTVLSDETGEAYRFYLTAGEHTLRLRVGLGGYRDILRETDECLTELNTLYREVVTVTGTDPDVDRDYQFELLLPDTLAGMRQMIGRLAQFEERLRALGYCGDQGTDAIRRIRTQLTEMTDRPTDLARRLTTYRSDISSLGTWRNGITEQPLLLDRIYIGPADMTLPQGEAGFFGSAGHYLRQFFWSFFRDYASVGATEGGGDTTVKAWMITGRDQAQVLKQLITDRFTPQEGIGVSLELVSADALLPALMAGTGPDVFFGMGQSDPVNLALRGALTDLTDLPGCADVLSRFSAGSYRPFRLKDGIYALPETCSYYMLFYRKDILQDLGIPLSDLDTWDGLLRRALPVLQTNALNVGIPATMNSYLTFLYQQGGTLYNDDLTASGLGSAEAVAAMSLYTSLYTEYGLQLSFDLANRFRSGEMPVAIADLLTYNQLTVFAPEIRGMWGMLPVPGTVQADGTVSHLAPSTVTGVTLMSSASDRDAAWRLMTWWTDADTQTAFGRDIESVVGSAARYNSANTEAFDSVGWDDDMLVRLQQQREWLRAVPEAPGGYYTSRHYDFAFRAIVYQGKNVRVSLRDAAESIDKELRKKQAEFGIE